MTADIKKLPRQLLPEDFAVTTWDNLEPWFRELEDRPLKSKADLEKWLKDMSELESVVSEDACWRQIRMTCDTENKALEEAFTFFCMQIQPNIQPYADRLNKKLIDCEFTAQLDQKKYFTYLRNIRKEHRTVQGSQCAAAGRNQCVAATVWGDLRKDDRDG